MTAYRRAVGRRFGIGAPSLVTKIGAWILGSERGLALTGRRCVPTRLLDEGVRFEITEIDHAVAEALSVPA